MSKQKPSQRETSTEKSALNEYHIKRNKEGMKAVEEMLKQPASFEEMKSQIQHNLNK